MAPRSGRRKAGGDGDGHNGVKGGRRPPSTTVFGPGYFRAREPGSVAEDHFIHDPSRRQSEQSGDDKGKGENPDDGLAVRANVMASGSQDSERNDRQRKQRQKMDRVRRFGSCG